ncbi:MAG: hypothetical protein HUU55_05380 [Myxococcales bacterium]|nr:hypothetical protein [Myxococcales bacterium]
MKSLTHWKPGLRNTVACAVAVYAMGLWFLPGLGRSVPRLIYKGDTLTGIARDLLLTNWNISTPPNYQVMDMIGELLRRNPHIDDPNLIIAGQSLDVPMADDEIPQHSGRVYRPTRDPKTTFDILMGMNTRYVIQPSDEGVMPKLLDKKRGTTLDIQWSPSTFELRFLKPGESKDPTVVAVFVDGEGIANFLHQEFNFSDDKVLEELAKLDSNKDNFKKVKYTSYLSARIAAREEIQNKIAENPNLVRGFTQLVIQSDNPVVDPEFLARLDKRHGKQTNSFPPGDGKSKGTTVESSGAMSKSQIRPRTNDIRRDLANAMNKVNQAAKRPVPTRQIQRPTNQNVTQYNAAKGPVGIAVPKQMGLRLPLGKAGR